MQEPRQRIQLSNAKCKKGVEILPPLPYFKIYIQLRKNLGNKTLWDLPWSLYLESVFNTHYSKQ